MIITLMKLRHYWPVHGLAYISCEELKTVRQERLLTLVIDIRDSSEYLDGHLPGTVNIPAGRLPYVWHQEIHAGDHVVVIGTSKYSLQKAARILKRKAEVASIQAWVAPKEKQALLWTTDKCLASNK